MYSLPRWQHRDVNYQGTLSCCWTFSAYQVGHFVGSRLLTDWITSSECSSSKENNKGLNTALKGQKCFVGQVVKDIQVILLGLSMPQDTRNIKEPEVKSQGWHKLYTIINVRRCSPTSRWHCVSPGIIQQQFNPEAAETYWQSLKSHWLSLGTISCGNGERQHHAQESLGDLTHLRGRHYHWMTELV